jgi:hypothetical protein
MNEALIVLPFLTDFGSIPLPMEMKKRKLSNATQQTSSFDVDSEHRSLSEFVDHITSLVDKIEALAQAAAVTVAPDSGINTSYTELHNNVAKFMYFLVFMF